jgi:hypothetical protein
MVYFLPNEFMAPANQVVQEEASLDDERVEGMMAQLVLAKQVLTVYFGAPSMFITLWFGFDYGTNPPLGTLIT